MKPDVVGHSNVLFFYLTKPLRIAIVEKRMHRSCSKHPRTVKIRLGTFWTSKHHPVFHGNEYWHVLNKMSG